jgi:hypothetical protein
MVSVDEKELVNSILSKTKLKTIEPKKEACLNNKLKA